MTSHILKLAGTIEEIDIRCPKCKSNQVIVHIDEEGYYEVLECYKCGFKGKGCSDRKDSFQ